MPRFRWFALTALVGLGFGVTLAGCALLTPLPRDSGLDDRLARFPTQALTGLERPVTIHWDAHQVPFLEAESDADLAYALGLVHAHLRLGQMEVLRRVAAGRLSEMGGPLARDIDQSLRLLDLGRAVPQIYAEMPDDTRAWLDAFVAGVNRYQETADPLPHEFAVLGLEREPWTPLDVLRIGRLASVDVNWVLWFQLLRQRDREDWQTLWARLQDTGATPTQLAAADDGLGVLTELLLGTGKSGSNAYAVAGERSRDGAGALIAADPHLGTNLPNLWLIAGYRSPSYHAVGLMIPGIPFVAVGRNPDIAWGGTNLRSANSDLFDVSDLAADAFTTRRERIGVRWWFDRTVDLRDSPLGPVISESPLIENGGGETLALRWIGHDPSDEMTAMLRLNRARDWEEFSAALDGFAISAQTMVYADRHGNIGRRTATHLPARPPQPAPDIVQPAASAAAWERIVTGQDLPARYNPPEGFVASANNRPEAADIAIGYVFSADDRIARLAELLGNGPVGVEDLAAFQTDVFQRSSLTLRDAWAAGLGAAAADGGGAPADPAAGAVLDRLLAWDGRYEAASSGALAFELTLFHFVEAYYDDDRYAAYQAGANPLALIAADIAADLAAGRPQAVTAPLAVALAGAAADFGRFGTWGEMHRLGLAHPLSFLPLIGGRYRFADIPAGGTSETLMKTAHSLTNERHFTRFGSQARHISDLSDMDRNWFVLLGGQDGWFNSSTFLDQFALWQAGDYVTVPLRPETARARARTSMVLTP